MQVSIRKIKREDIGRKVAWINQSSNNQFLHYDLPITVQETEKWFETVIGRTDRFDAVIEADGVPCGTIGLLSIDRKNSKAEYYIAMGETNLKGKGVATQASKLILNYAFCELGLNRVYLFTETENIPAQKLFEKVGFVKEGCLKNDIVSHGRFVDRFAYGICKEDYLKVREMFPTLIHNLGEYQGNQLYIKRDDLIPYSFGGNKARKAFLFFKEIDAGNYDCVVTYGSSHSNHCRIVANMAAARSMRCCIIGPSEVSDATFNSRFMDLFGAEITTVPVERVHDTIENRLQELRNEGHNPYFIPGGGHGNIGTKAYVQCYDEIRAYEQEKGIHFDYILFASGTGTTHAGLVCGQLLNGDEREIIGISIARKNPRGRDVVIDSIFEYLVGTKISEEEIQRNTIFVDDYIGAGYGQDNEAVIAAIKDSMIRYGIPLDSTYTGKAFYGMKQYLEKHQIREKNILFIHTGGTPLFFDDLKAIER